MKFIPCRDDDANANAADLVMRALVNEELAEIEGEDLESLLFGLYGFGDEAVDGVYALMGEGEGFHGA